MRQLKKSHWGALRAKWVAHDTRDQVVDYVRRWSERTELPAEQLVRWIGLSMSKYYDWKDRYGQVNEHNGLVPRDHWLESWEREAIVAFHAEHPLEGYRRLTYMLMDADVVAVSPATVYRVLKRAAARERRAARRRAQALRREPVQHHACANGTQRKASGVQGATMSPLVARADDLDHTQRPAEGETKSLSNMLNPLTPPCENSISR